MECTIIIPTKDRPTSLQFALASALASVTQYGEVLVVDDGSAVPVQRCLEKQGDPRLRVVRNEGKHGPAAARNYGVREARNELILFLDDDDLLLPGYAERVRKIAAGTDTKFGFSATREDAQLSARGLPDGPFPPEAPLSERLAGLGMGFWIYRNAFIEAGGLDEDLLVNEDTEFYLRLASLGVSGWYSRDPGVALRHSQGATSSDLTSITSRTSSNRRARAFEVMLVRYEKLLKKHPRLRWSFKLRLAKYRMRDRNVLGALRAIFGVMPHGGNVVENEV